MGCGEFIVKYVLFFANLFFALAGLALLGVGVAVELKVSGVMDALESHSVSVAPIFAIVVGSIVFLVAFFGCCGAIRESNCMLVMYAILMIILMVLKITLAVLIFVNLEALINDIPRLLNDAFSRDPAVFQQTIESNFECCGTTGAIAYLNVSLPPTCCASAPCTILNAYGGCNQRLEDFAYTFGASIGAIAIAVAAVELVAVVFSLCLANTIRNKDRRARY